MSYAKISALPTSNAARSVYAVVWPLRTALHGKRCGIGVEAADGSPVQVHLLSVHAVQP